MWEKKNLAQVGAGQIERCVFICASFTLKGETFLMSAKHTIFIVIKPGAIFFSPRVVPAAVCVYAK